AAAATRSRTESSGSGGGVRPDGLAVELSLEPIPRKGGRMAQRRQDLIGKLADRGEEALQALQKLGESAGAGRFVDVAIGLRERVDDLQKRVRELTAIERRVSALERKVDRLGAPSKGGR